MSRSFKLPELSKLQRPATLAKATTGPRLPKIQPTPENPDVMKSDTATTQAEFDSRFKQWGRGTKAEFAVYDHLTTRLKLVEARDFYYVPSSIRGDLTTFFLGSLAWRITGDLIIESKAQATMSKSKLAHNGYKVVDLKVQSLQFGMVEHTITLALKGTEV